MANKLLFELNSILFSNSVFLISKQTCAYNLISAIVQVIVAPFNQHRNYFRHTRLTSLKKLTVLCDLSSYYKTKLNIPKDWSIPVLGLLRVQAAVSDLARRE